MRTVISSAFNETDEAEIAAWKIASAGIKIYNRSIHERKKYFNEAFLEDVSTNTEAYELGADNVVLGSYPNSFAFPNAFYSSDYMHS